MSTECLLPRCNTCHEVCGRTYAVAGFVTAWHCSKRCMWFTINNSRPGCCEDCGTEPARRQGLCSWCYSQRCEAYEDEHLAMRSL